MEAIEVVLDQEPKEIQFMEGPKVKKEEVMEEDLIQANLWSRMILEILKSWSM